MRFSCIDFPLQAFYTAAFLTSKFEDLCLLSKNQTTMFSEVLDMHDFYWWLYKLNVN